MAYLHKKFKKLASVDVVGDRKEKSPSPVIVNHNDNAHDRSNAPLKHSIGSMVAPVSPPGPGQRWKRDLRDSSKDILWKGMCRDHRQIE